MSRILTVTSMIMSLGRRDDAGVGRARAESPGWRGRTSSPPAWSGGRRSGDARAPRSECRPSTIAFRHDRQHLLSVVVLNQAEHRVVLCPIPPAEGRGKHLCSRVAGVSPRDPEGAVDDGGARLGGGQGVAVMATPRSAGSRCLFRIALASDLWAAWGPSRLLSH